MGDVDTGDVDSGGVDTGVDIGLINELTSPHASANPGPEVLVQGVKVPMLTPVLWLTLNASHLDCFLHLVVRLPGHCVLEKKTQM
mmetsp:Transcript_2589/g.3022  ORF Transcript_2589/g.3022 Transcript_2589/m.3022 type:complete len:85 (-) Transcript_2589:45-299(-)